MSIASTSGSQPRAAAVAIVAIVAMLCSLALALPVAASSGPAIVKNINQSGDANPSYLARVGSLVFFAANDGLHGTELWKTDGTAAGTKMVKNIRPYAKGSFPQDLINVNGTLFFTATDGVHGRELWKSNGTAAGTVMVKDLLCSEFACNQLDSPVAVGDRLFFFVTWCCLGEGSLMVSDGTPTGTREVVGWLPMGQVGDARALGNKLFFVRHDYRVDPDQASLWVSNGTAAGTHVVNGSPVASQMSILPASGANLYFASQRFVSGQARIRLWRTDPTASGTVALTTAGQLTVMPEEAVYLNHAIYFGSNGLWRTDGTAAGTRLISSGTLRDLAKAGGRVFFIRGEKSGAADDHLWSSDGSTAGTRDLGAFGIDPGDLAGVGGYLCFFAGYSVGHPELWQSNGTTNGTHRVRSWVSGRASLPGLAVGSTLYFAAYDSTRGNELWRYTP